jgi:hypothetical protein
MTYYMPKLSHAMVAALICIGLIALGAKAQGRVLVALNIGALIFAIITAAILWMLIIQTVNERLDRLIELAKIYSGMDDEARQALAYQFPAMQYHMKHGEVRAYFEDTNVPIDTFRLFLQTSNDRYISPERDWQTKEMPAWAHTEIRLWLEANDKVIRDSAAGSHSWLWKGNSYKHLMAYWMSGHAPKDMTSSEMVYGD